MAECLYPQQSYPDLGAFWSKPLGTLFWSGTYQTAGLDSPPLQMTLMMQRARWLLLKCHPVSGGRMSLWSSD